LVTASLKKILLFWVGGGAYSIRKSYTRRKMLVVIYAMGI
jgi:hypothetical protein